MQLVYLAFITPVVYDFYNYEMESQQFVKLFTMFSQVCSTKSRSVKSFSFEPFHHYLSSAVLTQIPLPLSLIRTWPSSARCSSSWEWRTPSQGGTPREGPQRLRQPEASQGIVVGGEAINMETRRVLRILLEQYMSRFLPIGFVSWGPAEFDM